MVLPPPAGWRPFSFDRFDMLSSALGASAPDFSTDHFRRTLAQFATGVTVVTVRLPEGCFHGVTVSSFNSVSLEPPLVLWSLARKARSMPVFAASGHYLINVLSAGQADLATRFARAEERHFDGLQFELSRTGLPVFPDVAAWFECRNRSQYAEGDHVIFVGEVERCALNATRALGFHGGRFVII